MDDLIKVEDLESIKEMLFDEIKEDNFVPPEGSLTAKYVIVGEAPGAEEARMKRPWIGPAGNLLMELLSNSGIRRQHCYLTNVIKERPLNNDATKFIKFKKSGVETTEATRNYIQMLKTELEQTTANVIVAAGNISIFALTGLTAITKRRGSVYESTLLPGRKVIPIIHPSASFHQYMYQRYIAADLAKVVEEAEFPEIRLVKRKYITFPSFSQVMVFLDSICKDNEYIAADIEVIRGEVSHISFATNSSNAMSICFFKNNKNFFSLHEEAKIWRKIGNILESRKYTKLFQNGAFDAWFLFRKYGIVIQPIYDTMIAMAFAYPDFPKGLDFLCSMFTDMPYYKDEGKRHMKVISNEEEFAQYSAKDSIVLPEIMSYLRKDLETQGNWDYFLRHCELIAPITFMQERGVAINQEKIQSERAAAVQEVTKIEEEFQAVTGIPDINLGSDKQIKNYFYVNLGIKPFTKSVKRAGGNRVSSITVDEKALTRLAAGTKTRAPRKEAQLLLRHRKLTKLITTYYNMSIDPDGRLRSQFNPVGTRTGRLSSGKNIFGTGANFQNIPEDFRKCFVADEGYLLFEVDLSQAEWRIVAYLAQDYNMISVLEAGKDIHRRTAGLIFNKPEDLISDEPGSTDIGGGDYSERFIGKKSNHSLDYDLSANGLALELMITVNEARFIRSQYLSGYPGIEGTFWESVKNSLAKDRTVTDLFGRSYTFLDRWGHDLFRAAYAYRPQSTVAGIVNRRGLRPIYYRRDLFKEIEIIAQIHDSILFQVKIDNNFDKIAGQLKLIKARLETPIEYLGQRFVIPADITCGFNWRKYRGSGLGEGMNKLISDNSIADQIESIWKLKNG